MSNKEMGFTGRCNSEYELWRQRFNVLFSTALDVVTDVTIMALPIALLPSLQLNIKKKIGLGVAFSLAVLIICVAIVRMTQVIVNEKVDLIGLAIWGAIETSTAVIVGSLPPLKSFLTRGVKKYSSNVKSGQKYGKHISSYHHDELSLGSANRTIMVAESIPLDDVHKSNHLEGGIYVQKMFETHVEYESSSKNNDDEEVIMKKMTTKHMV
ncbi:hypothetical protein QQS21_011467 [Conoideocrella luteorostrata]|uniref:Rhodopsin domain-containing protein n=1 Tax=Conoideocrella luteorostrata TaxID=1105319 RepID=A0AAJ0CD28_9HYPO|nr:hypothetical protein QQS21_011467 [Conoideocrella luteorostrata]